jgi:hypothetical protein
MGLFDLPAPLFSLIDGLLDSFLPIFIRLVLWGILAGWLTMIVYRRLSNQEKIGLLKAELKARQKLIAKLDGEFEELLPLIRKTLGTGFRQLGLALGPALLATIPVLFLVVWVAGQFGHGSPQAGEAVAFTATPSASTIEWQPADIASKTGNGWSVKWPAAGATVIMSSGERELLSIPLPENIPVIHKKQWWNLFMANPIGYLPADLETDVIEIGLPQQVSLPFGPDWMRGWMFSFFMSFLLASVAFKFILKID